MSISAAFALIWVAFTVATVLAVLPILVWSFKSGQYSDRDHARWLPLLSDGPKTDLPTGELAPLSDESRSASVANCTGNGCPGRNEGGGDVLP